MCCRSEYKLVLEMSTKTLNVYALCLINNNWIRYLLFVTEELAL